MKRPAFLDSRHPAYQFIFVATLVIFSLLLALGVVHAWNIFRRPPTIRINPVILGNRLMEEKKYNEALVEYEKTVLVEPGNFEAWSRMGTISSQLGDHEKALAHYERALTIRSRNPQLLANAGNACFKLKRLSDAAVYYRRAIQYAPDNATYHNSLGGMLAMSGDPAAAIPSFERALELQPDHATAKRNLDMARRDAAAKTSAPQN